MISLARSTAQPSHALRRARPLAALGVIALIAVAGCTGAGGGKKPAAKPMSAAKAITLAAQESQHINSLAAKIYIVVASQSETIGMVMDMQLKPATLIHATINASGGGASGVHIEEILTNKAIYLNYPGFAQKVGKPWIGMTLAQLSSKSGVNFAALMQNIENSNPENQVKFFAASKDVHVVGSRTVNGIPTTEYAGSYTPAAAFKELPAGLRKLLGPMLRIMGNQPATFRVWIDVHHLTRKAVVNETIAGQSAVTSYMITSVNQPVHVTLPAPGDVAQLPTG